MSIIVTEFAHLEPHCDYTLSKVIILLLSTGVYLNVWV